MGGKKGKGKPGKSNGRNQQEKPQAPPSAPVPPSAAPPQNAQSAIKHGDSHGQYESKLPNANWLRPWWKQLLAASVAIATVVAAWAAVEMRNSAREQLEATKLEQRPRLTFDGLQMNPFVEGKDVVMSIAVKNSGKLPGRITGFAHDVHVIPKQTFEYYSASQHRVTEEMAFDFYRTLDEMRANRATQIERVRTAGGEIMLPIVTEWRMTGDLLRPIDAGVMQPVLVVYLKYVELDAGCERESWTCFLYDRHSHHWIRDHKYDHMD